MYLNQPTAPAQQAQPTPPSRPLSRSAGVYLNPPSGFFTNPQSTNLSAREQMHVARATGTPLLDTVANARKKKQQEDESLGLVGAIGAREREKAAMKTSHRSSMVVENAFRDRTSISIHCYGGNIGAIARSVFDPATGAARPFISGYHNSSVPNLWDRSRELAA